MKHDVGLTVLGWDGNLTGITLPQGPKARRLRVLQYSKYLDQKSRYDAAAKIVEQKITNSFNLPKELSRYYDVLDVKLIEKKFAEQVVNYKTTHASKSRNNLLMLYEGMIATFY